MHPSEAILREFSFVAGSLDVLLSETIGLVHARLDLGLNGQRHFQVQWRERVDQEIADGGIQCFAVHALADGLGVLNPRRACTRRS